MNDASQLVASLCTCPCTCGARHAHDHESEAETPDTIAHDDLRGDAQHAINVKAYFAGRTVDCWRVENEGRPGEKFTKVGEYRSVLLALTMANFDAKHNHPGGAEYLLCSSTGERVAKVRVHGTCVTPLEWIHPARLARLQEMESASAAGRSEAA